MANHRLGLLQLKSSTPVRGVRHRREETDQVRVNVGLVSAALLAALTVATVSPERGASFAGCGRGRGRGRLRVRGLPGGFDRSRRARDDHNALDPDVGAGARRGMDRRRRSRERAGRRGLVAPGRRRRMPGEEPFDLRGDRSLDGTARAQDDCRRCRARPGLPPRRAGDQAEAGLVAGLGRRLSRLDAVRLPGTDGGWKPIGDRRVLERRREACNSFAFRFQDVALAAARGGSWRPFEPGAASWTGGYRLRRLEPRRRTGASARRSRSSSSSQLARDPGYATILTGVPTRTSVRRKTMSSLCRRTQPCETA